MSCVETVSTAVIHVDLQFLWYSHALQSALTPLQEHFTVTNYRNLVLSSWSISETARTIGSGKHTDITRAGAGSDFEPNPDPD